MKTRAGAAVRSAMWVASLAMLALPACRGGESQPPGAPSASAGLTATDPAVVAESFIEASRALTDSAVPIVSDMERAMSTDPRVLVSMLETSAGGGTAARRYAKAMLDSDRGEALGRQLDIVLRGGDPQQSISTALSKSFPRDESAFFDNAEDAGFFAGAVAWALEEQADPRRAASRLALGLHVSVSADDPPEGSWNDWIRDIVFPRDSSKSARPGVPAEHAFDRAFRRTMGVPGTARVTH